MFLWLSVLFRLCKWVFWYCVCIKEVSRKGGGLEREKKAVCLRQGWKGIMMQVVKNTFQWLWKSVRVQLCETNPRTLRPQDKQQISCTIGECFSDAALTECWRYTPIKSMTVDRKGNGEGFPKTKCDFCTCDLFLISDIKLCCRFQEKSWYYTHLAAGREPAVIGKLLWRWPGSTIDKRTGRRRLWRCPSWSATSMGFLVWPWRMLNLQRKRVHAQSRGAPIKPNA